ncbi:hypothetical protein HRbin06_00790 [archaeon HR06]|nr:hypothetical protein HRbin06_00790 [archaeon HR06]
MSKKKEVSGKMGGWKYVCTCGYSTLNVGEAVKHINENTTHQLTRVEL